MKRRMQYAMFAAAIAAALGFGGAQAFASPGAGAQGARACDLAQCDAGCKARGFSGGYCQMEWCGCYVDVPPAS